MAPLRRVSKFPIAAEKGIITTLGGSLVIPSKENTKSPLIGREAPEIDLVDHEGRRCSLHATIALGRPIVLFFFPLAGSPHCTQESCMFRDALQLTPVFSDLNVIVIGISQDPPETLKRFHEKHKLTYRILCDQGRNVMNTYGVGSILGGLIDARCTFIIDPNGTIRGVAEGVFDAMGHLRFAERWLIRLEHELSLRARIEVDYAITSGDLAAYPQSHSGPIRRVMYGQAGSARGGGVGGAPRYGAASAAPVFASTTSSLSLSRTPKSSLVSDTSTATTSTMASSTGFWQEQGTNIRKAGLSGILAQLSSADDQPPPMVSAENHRFVSHSTDTDLARTGDTVASSQIDFGEAPLMMARNGSSDGSSLHSNKQGTPSVRSATRPKSKKGSGLGSLFRSKRKAPPIPPTYAHLDRQEEEYGEVERDSDAARSSSSGAPSLMESQPSNGSLADLRLNGSGLAAAASTSGSVMPSAHMSRKGSVPDLMPRDNGPRPGPVKSRPRSSSHRNSGFVGPSASSPPGSSSPAGHYSSLSHSMDSAPAWASGSGRRAREASAPIEFGRSSKGPDDVPRDALDDEEEFVVQHSNGRLTFSPKPAPIASMAPTPSQLHSLASALSLRERDELSPILAAPEARPASRGRRQAGSRTPSNGYDGSPGSLARASSRPASSKSFRSSDGKPGEREQAPEVDRYGSLPSRSSATSPLATELSSRSRTPVKRGPTPTRVSTPPRQTPPPQAIPSKVPWGATPEGRSSSTTPLSSSWNAASQLSRSPATVDTSTPSGNSSIFARRPSRGDPNRSPRLVPRPAPPPVYAPPPPPSGEVSHDGEVSLGASPKTRGGVHSLPPNGNAQRNGAPFSASSHPSSSMQGSLPPGLSLEGLHDLESTYDACHSGGGSESYNRSGSSSVAHSTLDKASPNTKGTASVNGTPNPNSFSPNMHASASPASSFSSHIFLDDARRPSLSSVESHGTFGGAAAAEDDDRTY